MHLKRSHYTFQESQINSFWIENTEKMITKVKSKRIKICMMIVYRIIRSPLILFFLQWGLFLIKRMGMRIKLKGLLIKEQIWIFWLMLTLKIHNSCQHKDSTTCPIHRICNHRFILQITQFKAFLTAILITILICSFTASWTSQK